MVYNYEKIRLCCDVEIVWDCYGIWDLRVWNVCNIFLYEGLEDDFIENRNDKYFKEKSFKRLDLYGFWCLLEYKFCSFWCLIFYENFDEDFVFEEEGCFYYGD